MRAFKNRNAFTLIEVLLAIVIIGLVMTPIFVLEGNTFRSISIGARNIDRITSAFLFMTQTGIDKKKEPTSTVEKKIGATNMRYQMMELPKDSSLKDTKNMYVERVTMTWQEGRKKKEETIVMLRYRPEVKKE
jgi:prepilin-type N-terminal cleavage/methylation domain-containing protein